MTQIVIERITKEIDGGLVSRLKAYFRRDPLEASSLALVLALSIVAGTARFIEVSSAHSLEWDSGSFLTNAGVYAGLPQFSQSYDPTRPPFIPFVISVLFRLTGPSATDGYIVSSILLALSITGAYFLARRVMKPPFAAISAISFGLSPIVLEWSGIAVSDVEGVAVATLAFASLIYASDGHRRLYLLALPLLVLAPLTRYSLASILIVSVVYLISSGRFDKVFDPFEFYYGFGLSILTFAVVGLQWILYPFVNHLSLASLFPTTAAVNPYHSSLGAGFYLINLPSVLGLGDYGYVLVALFAASAGYAVMLLARSVTDRITGTRQVHQRIDPMIVALLAWFTIMVVYYSFIWPYDDTRYAIEFALPVFITAFWGLSRACDFVYGMKRKIPGKMFGTILALAVIFLLSTPIFYLAIESGFTAYHNTPVLETQLNAGLEEASAWLQSRVRTSVPIESNWYTLLWWYDPHYKITPAPLYFQLTSSAGYVAWNQMIAKDKIGYVVYVDPSQIQVPGELTPVFRSSLGNVVVYEVNAGNANLA